jgi:hypothetical protein
MNRLRQHPEEEEPPRAAGGDHFSLSARSATWCVSTEMARHVETCLEQGRPGWVSFVELTGSRVRLRTREIEYLAQSTLEQRASARALQRALNRERRQDRRWSEDQDE